jgi:copper(I)-binding protein
MKRFGILFCLVLIGIVASLLNDKQAGTISLFDASAVQSPGDANEFMVALSIENNGEPDRLISASSPSALNVSIMNPSADGSAIIIPKNGRGILAMDGAHIIIMAMPGTFEQGAFLPLNLTFENAGSVSVRVQNTGTAAMNHGLANGISETPTPDLGLTWTIAPGANGAVVKLNTENFTFINVEDGTAHAPNHGHAHVYLNGLKLGRLYSDTYQFGALSPGNYTLSVALNSNDHRPYVNDNGPVMDTLVFEILN